MNKQISCMDTEQFLRLYPEKPENAYKGQSGRTLLIGGSFGMAGAVCLNILGAQTVGADYICCALDSSIYPIAAARFLTPVFYPMDETNWKSVLSEALNDKISAVAFGSGTNRLPYKQELLEHLLRECRVPLLLDAEALQLLSSSKELLKTAQCPVILTPHIGEFSRLSGSDAEEILKDRVPAAASFAQKHKVILVLKGPHTIIVGPEGSIMRNNSGNPALAQAGSGDVLTGIMAGLLTLVKDPFTAVTMAVWLHGHLADMALSEYSVHSFPLESYPQLMNRFLRENSR